jgi:aarF domain-containing kinase
LNQRDKLQDKIEQRKVLKDCHKRCAERTLKVLEKNGGIFIKLGQHLSAMNYLLPVEWTTTFVPLQDKCPVSSFESIEQMFRDDTGKELQDYFSVFETEPIGAASLAQVHLATVKETGQKVAVKVQHPGLAQWAPLDLALTKYTFATLKRFFPEYDLEWLSSEMEVSLPKELDFQQEADNALRTKEYFSHIPRLPLVIPDVIWAKERILVMACESGHRPDDLEYLDSNGIDRDEVSATLARIFNEMIFGSGAPLHCDPHGGNIAIRKNDSRSALSGLPNFDVVLYDHGLYRDIPIELRRSYAKMWLAVIDGDMPRMRRYAHEVANVSDSEFPLFASAITGRDYSVVSQSGSILKPRNPDEQETMSSALQESLLADLVGLLGRVPRIILLILKTNDLTRSLDENLHTRQGPVRTFLILARYCARTVWQEQREEIGNKGSVLWPGNLARLAFAWLGYFRVVAKLEVFELWLGVKRALGSQGTAFAGM